VQDGNMGLVKLALAARTVRATQKLTQTYLTLSLADIAAQVGLPGAGDAEAHILRRAPPDS
jgi:COP9 signalosome complex subunit 3